MYLLLDSVGVLLVEQKAKGGWAGSFTWRERCLKEDVLSKGEEPYRLSMTLKDKIN